MSERPARGAALRAAIIDRNPFLLASALLVLGGGWLVAAADGARGTFQLILLFAFLQAYELALLGASGFIERFVARRDPRAYRDAATLLVLEALFLGDVSLTNSVFPGTKTTGFELGIDREDLVVPALVAAVAVVLGPVKLWLAGRAGRITWPRGLGALVVGALCVIHLGPIAVNLAGEHERPDAAIRWLAWAVALVPVAVAAIVRAEPSAAPAGLFGPRRGLVTRALGAALTFAAASHVAAAAWAHQVALEPSLLSPLLLGVAAATPQLLPGSARSWTPVRVVFTVAAFCLEGSVGSGSFAAFRADSVVAGLVLLDVARRDRSVPALVGALTAFAAASLGDTPRAVGAALEAPPLAASIVSVVVALGFSVARVTHPLASLAGAAAAFSLAGGSPGIAALRAPDALLAISLFASHQTFLAHRQESAAWLGLRTWLARAALASGLLSALLRGPSLVDLEVLALVAAGLLARRVGIGTTYGVPCGAALTVLVGARLGPHLPRDRSGIGLLALGGGLASLAAGLVVTVLRQRLLGDGGSAAAPSSSSAVAGQGPVAA